LIDALAERFPDSIEDAAAALPNSALRYVSRALEVLKQHLPKESDAAWDTLQPLIDRL
jgi:hypothetical protein